MSLRSSDRQWGSVAKFFHWTTALLIIGNGIFGLMQDMAGTPMQKINWLALHKSIGLTVLALLLLRALWRFADRNQDMVHLAHSIHENLWWFLLLLLVAHIGAALKHHVIDRDNTLLRMLPFRRLRDGSPSQGEH